MSILKVQYKYFPYPLPTDWSVPNFRFDEAKMNLLWLVCPEVDKVHDKKWDGNVVTESINLELDGETRELLKTLLPTQFMKVFSRECADYAMTEFWPTHYLETMWTRARTAERRLTGDNSNVVHVNFRKKVA